MIATTPLEIDGQVYDRFSMNLIVSGTYTPEGQPEASVVCNLTPTRIADGAVETLPQNTINIRLGALAQADESTLAAVGAIQSALQTFISEKGI